ncbi:enhancer of split m8 protein-like [Mercenaria mercenaria]|uniref:enhancer of split m8 protein-like n=1 Tax=Mercenaria mercenaria TaxID=6596 RepID=UPI00234EDBF6|nr:enhancer of split m8 protein-like [Mercenaria mercenaria]
MVGTSSIDATDASFLRKNSIYFNFQLRKPLIEKRRRDRMNVSIDNLKAILAKSSKNAGSVVKMDKAEILELAVAHLSQLQQQQPKSSSANHVSSYRAGFRECRKETVRYLSSATQVSSPLLQDLDNHLHNVCDTSRQNEVIMSSAARRHSFVPERLCTSSPTIDLPPAPAFSPFCRNSMFSPISSVDIRGDRVHSPLDSMFVNSMSRASSPCSAPSPAPSTCSSAASDSSISGISVNCVDSNSDFDGIASKSDIVLGHVIKQEAPWRPW